nr:helix-turn-helix domain-containing protein [Achromobacter sp.]
MQDSDAAAAGPRTLRRGLAVLAALRDQGPDGLSVTDIARLTGIQRPTIYRLLAALLDAGLVLPVTGTKKYRAQLAVDPDTRSRDPRVRQLLPVLRRLADRTGDAVFLVVRDEDDSISLHREIGSYPVQILATYAGKRQPLGVGSGGMALLAALPDDVARGIVERNSGRLDEYGGMTPQEMYRLIENTRARGYSVVGNHAVRGALGVG